MTLQAAEKPAESLSRTDRYMARVQREIAGMASDAQRADFLSREHVKWIARYGRFEQMVDAGTYVDPNGPSASDYVCTIAALGALKSKYDKAQCDCCARMFPREEIERVWAPGGLETFACEECRGMP